MLSYAAVNGFMGMFCVEYVTTFLLMALISLLILAVCFAVIYLFRPKDFKLEQIGLLLLLGLLPYGRYLVLGSHSYQHYFFTYRAQMVTVFALLYVTWRWGICGQKKSA